MTSRTAVVLAAWLAALPSLGVGLAVWQAHRAVRSAETRLLEAETGIAARLLEAGHADRLVTVLGARWARLAEIDPWLDEPIVEVQEGRSAGRAAVYDADGWDAVAQVRVDDDAARRAKAPIGLWVTVGVSLFGLALLARRTAGRSMDGAEVAPLSRLAFHWVMPAALLVLLPLWVAAHWSIGALASHTDRRLDLGGEVLAGRADLADLARRPSGILDLTGLRFVPGDPAERTADLLGASALPVEVARRLAAAEVPANRRVEVDAVEYAALDVERIRLFLLPYDHTERPTVMMAATAGVGVLAGLPVVALLAIARDGRRLRRELVAWSFLAPSVLHLTLFTFGPLLFAAWLSLHRWSLVDAAKPFIGFQNYVALASNDRFWNAIWNTAVFTLHVPFSMAIALGLALLVRRTGRVSVAARAAFFLPSITSIVAVAMVWQWILHDQYGLANWLLGLAGLPRVAWLSSPSVALLSVMLVATWTTLGFQTVLFQAGLTAIPRDLYDAARIDGAGRWQQFVHVTLPGLRPTLFFVLVTSVISSFQVFGTVYVMTEGGPLHATDVAVFHIYEEAWELQRVGSAAAMSWTLFAIIFVVTWLHFRTLERRVE